MLLYFKKPQRACGYALQMIIDTEQGRAEVGYCLTIKKCIEIKAKDFDSLYNELLNAGFIQGKGGRK